MLSGGDFRLGVRVLRPERLPRRAASAARLVGHADFGRDDLLLFVRRAHRCLCRRGGAGVRPTQLLGGVVTMAAAAVMIGQGTPPWELYVANPLVAFRLAGPRLSLFT